MALHSKWSSGDLIFYDGTQTVFTIQDDDEGLLVGADGDGVDVKFYGDTTGAYLHFDESADLVDFHNINITYRDPQTQSSTGDNITLTADSNRNQFLDVPSCGLFAILPASTGSNAGVEFKIFNCSTGTFPIVVKEASSGGTTIMTLDQNEGGIVISNGSEWRGFVGGKT